MNADWRVINSHDHQGAEYQRWRVAQTKRFLEISGPDYIDTEVTVRRHGDKSTWIMIGRETMKLNRSKVSYASWFMLRQAAPGDTVSIKIRCDEVAAGN